MEQKSFQAVYWCSSTGKDCGMRGDGYGFRQRYFIVHTGIYQKSGFDPIFQVYYKPWKCRCNLDCDIGYLTDSRQDEKGRMYVYLRHAFFAAN